MRYRLDAHIKDADTIENAHIENADTILNNEVGICVLQYFV